MDPVPEEILRKHDKDYLDMSSGDEYSDSDLGDGEDEEKIDAYVQKEGLFLLFGATCAHLFHSHAHSILDVCRY